MSKDAKTDKPMESWKAWGTVGGTIAALALTPLKAVAGALIATAVNPLTWIPTALTLGTIGAVAYGGAFIADRVGTQAEGKPSAVESVNKVVLGAVGGIKAAAGWYARAFGKAWSDLSGGLSGANKWAKEQKDKREVEGTPEIDLTTAKLDGKTLGDFGKVAKAKAADVVVAANDVAVRAKQTLGQ